MNAVSAGPDLAAEVPWNNGAHHFLLFALYISRILFPSSVFYSFIRWGIVIV